MDIKCVGSRFKIVGTLICVSGAMAISLMRGPALSQLWASRVNSISDFNTLYPVENILVGFLHEGNGDLNKQLRGCIYLVSAVTILSTTLILQVFPPPYLLN